MMPRRSSEYAPIFSASSVLLTRSHGKAGTSALDHLLRLVQRIDGKGNDIDILLLELFDMGLIIGDLPNTVRSPDAR
jgi:hypothetical protein